MEKYSRSELVVQKLTYSVFSSMAQENSCWYVVWNAMRNEIGFPLQLILAASVTKLSRTDVQSSSEGKNSDTESFDKLPSGLLSSKCMVFILLNVATFRMK